MPVQLIFLALSSALVAVPLALWTDLSWWGALLLSPPLALVGIGVLGAVIDLIERPAVREWERQEAEAKKDDSHEAGSPSSLFFTLDTPACPQCRAGQAGKILYGQPVDPEALQPLINAGRVVLESVEVFDGAPRWQCRSCGHRFGSVQSEKRGREQR